VKVCRIRACHEDHTEISIAKISEKPDVSETFLTSGGIILRASGDIHITCCRVPTAEQADLTPLKPEK